MLACTWIHVAYNNVIIMHACVFVYTRTHGACCCNVTSIEFDHDVFSVCSCSNSDIISCANRVHFGLHSTRELCGRYPSPSPQP